MSEETVVAAPSAAQETSATPEIDVNLGPLVTWTREQRDEYRKTGNPPALPKTEDSASSEEKKQIEDPADAASPAKPQEQGSKGKDKTEKRFQELLEERKALKAEVEALKSSKAQSEAPKPQPAQTQSAQQEPTPEDKNADGTLKFKTYEEYTKALARWEVRQELAQQQREQQLEAQQRDLKSKVDAAKSRYPDFDQVVIPATNAFVSDQSISPVVKQMVGESEVMTDLLYTIASNAEEMSKFTEMARTNPGKALRYIAITESLIQNELEGKPQTTAPTTAPVKPQTSAPKPPSEVGGRSSTPADAMEEALRSNNYRAFSAESTRRALARLKG